MLTNKDVEKLKETFATKEDLKQFATKEDLKQFATKEDLKKSTEETKRHFDVVAEDIINSNKLVLEQFSTHTGKLAEHEEKIEILETGFSVLKSRVAIIESSSRK